MPDFYIAAEASIPYEFVAPDGSRAVLNDPTDTDFCGYLDGEDALTGIDSPEVRDSFAELSGRDGALSGANFYSRRPIVMNGRVIPTSAADRNAKLGKLMAATNAMRADGTLSWTPSGGEPVFLKFRRQLPFRTKGGFNKEFQLGLVANDPRIFSKRALTFHMGTEATSNLDDYWRLTRASGSTLAAGTRALYLPPGKYRVTVPVKASVTGKTLTVTVAGATAVVTSPKASTAGWQLVSTTFTKTTAEGTAVTVGVDASTALAVGQYVEVGNVLTEGLEGAYPSAQASFATRWTASSGMTLAAQSASPPPTWVQNPGAADAHPLVRMIGPSTLANVAYAAPLTGQLSLSATYASSEYYACDTYWKTLAKFPGGSSDYGSLHSSTVWGPLAAGTLYSPRILTYSGASVDTRADMTWRGVWI